MNNLRNVNETLAASITGQRFSVVYQHITDLKFVTGMTPEIFTAIRYNMTVSTNINTASVEEFLTLGIAEVQAINIVNSRATIGPFEDIGQLRARNLITQTLFNSIQHFISVEHVERIEFSRPNFRANINLANNSQLTRAGTTAAQANIIIAQRAHRPLRNLQELLPATGVLTSFNIWQTIALSDNLRTLTNLNTAPISELESLFGTSILTAAAITGVVNSIISAREIAPLSMADFAQVMSDASVAPAVVNSILPFVYVYEPPVRPLVNLNTASQQQLTDAGIPLATAQQIIRLNRGSIQLPSQIPAFITPAHRELLSLRTNINNATQQELLSLDAAMTPAIAQRIITQRNDQPFGSLAEVEQFFSSLQLSTLYQRIWRVIIVK
jgi:DNA uptake protein ComE-like DNA-binding protein